MSGKFVEQKVVDECIHDLRHRWNNRVRKDREVLGAVELAFMRGYQAGFVAARKIKRRKKA